MAWVHELGAQICLFSLAGPAQIIPLPVGYADKCVAQELQIT
jgi:hypothetical protein